MSDERHLQSLVDGLPDAVVKKNRGISIVWFIPLIAAIIGSWLTFKTIYESGPTITITFEDAAGLEAGKTKVKYKSVIVGEIKSIELQGLHSVTVTAKMAKSCERFMTEDTKFWIVRPRIGGSEISGLDTLISGAYISFDPRPGSPTLKFKGLEKPPGVLVDEKGAQFTLHTADLGSSFPGTPILHRGVTVGRVAGYEFAKDDNGVLINIFIKAPYHLLIRDSTRFWQTSGIDISFNTEGLEINVESLTTLIAGGISFDTPQTSKGANKPLKPGAVYRLFKTYNSIGESRYLKTVPFLLHFDGSIRGLTEGAPVEFRGIKVGSVTSVEAFVNPKTDTIEIPVVIAIQPERLSGPDFLATHDPYEFASIMIERGMRAQLQTGSLLTGQLYVDLDLHPDLPKKSLLRNGEYPEIPSIPSTLNLLKENALDLLDEIRKVPFDAIGQNLLKTMQGANKFANSPELSEAVHTLHKTIGEFHELTRDEGPLSRSFGNLESLTQNMDTKVETLSGSVEKTLSAIRLATEIIDPNSPTAVTLTTALDELSSAARSVRGLADYLARHPESLINGKGKEKGN